MRTIALVLAGGEGKRFSPIVTSKPLFPFFGKPIVSYTLSSLSQAGFKEAVVVSSPQDQKQIDSLKITNLKIETIVQKSAKGMADAVLSAEKLIRGKSIFVLNSEDLVDQSLFDQAFRKMPLGKNFIVARKQKEYFAGGYLKFKDDKLAAIVEKPGEGQEPSDLLNLVFHFFSGADEFLEALKKTKSQKDDVYEKALSLIIKNRSVKVQKYQGYWQPFKYPWHILDMTKLYLNQKLEPKISKQAKIHKSAVIEGPVIIEDGVSVYENAVIKGPTYIGPSSIIGTSALIIESMVGANCVVGFTSEITRSYLGDGCWLHRNYVGDSVLEKQNYLGAGVVTANFRFDEDHIHSQILDDKINTKKIKFGTIIGESARVGVNASLMPGVKIGAKAIVGPGVVCFKDIKPGEKVF